MTTKFCDDCAKCSDEKYEDSPTKRLCGAASDRINAHLSERGKTPDAYFTKPEVWVYSNSSYADKCRWFSPQEPRFAAVSCSHCGKGFGPMGTGFSHCDQHAHMLGLCQEKKAAP